MTRAERLLALIALLRRSRYAVTAQTLAEKLGVSVRTIYRDIDTLRAQHAPIEGEAGTGYQLKQGFTLPPLMFNNDELAALVLGLRWSAAYADQHLAEQAKNVLGKIKSVLPPNLITELQNQYLYPVIPKTDYQDGEQHTITLICTAIRTQHKVQICYSDAAEQTTNRLISPLAIAYFLDTRLVSAWCDIRQDYRHFRSDRMQSIHLTPIPFDRPHQQLLQDWLEQESLNLDHFDWETLTPDRN